jgi:hypothetical protein
MKHGCVLRYAGVLALVTLLLTACNAASGAANPLPTDEPHPTQIVSTPTPTDGGLAHERTVAEREVAMEAIRDFVGNPGLSVTYAGMTTDYNNSDVIVEVYEAAETQFMVDVRSNGVVYMQIVSPSRTALGEVRLSPAELEAKVREFLFTKNPCFGVAESHLEFRPGNKVDNYFFRWQSPLSDPSRPLDQPTFIQVAISIDGTIFGYVDSGICQLDLDRLPTVTPTPLPTDTPPPPAPVATVPPPQGYEDWLAYTNAAYGFLLRYPSDWTLEENQNPASTLQGHALTLKPEQTSLAVLHVSYKRFDQDLLITRTGVGAGELVTRGAVSFLGQEIVRQVLVDAEKDMTVLYGSGGEISRGELVFALGLDYVGLSTDVTALSADMQAAADMIVASFELVP